MTEAEEILLELVNLKRYSEREGKDEYYRQAKKEIWEKAKNFTDVNLSLAQ